MAVSKDELFTRGLSELDDRKVTHDEASVRRGIREEIERTRRVASKEAIVIARKLVGDIPLDRFNTPAVQIDERTDNEHGQVKLVAVLDFSANTRPGLEGIPPLAERVTKPVSKEDRFTGVSVILVPESKKYKGALDTLVEKTPEGEEVWGKLVSRVWLKGYFPDHNKDEWGNLNGELEYTQGVQQLVEQVSKVASLISY